MALNLTGGIGRGGDNRGADVRSVNSRHTEPRFRFLSVNNRFDPRVTLAIRLFLSIIAGQNALRRATTTMRIRASIRAKLEES
jgi:hypothetical protein